MIRFVVYGGWVCSINDGDEHYISARAVARLHHVDPRECLMVDRKEDKRGCDVSRLLPLRPYTAHYSPVTPAERRQHPISD